MITKKEYNKRVLLKYFVYFFGVVLGVCLLLKIFEITHANTFFESIEARSFDMRQKTISANKTANPNIVIVTVDNPSYEYLVNKYGEWPMPRSVYADIAEFIEQQKPAAVAFDLMFVNSMKSSKSNDNALADKFKKYDNLYTAINFDDTDEQIRKAEKLPDKLKVNVQDKSIFKNIKKNINYSNCRMILREIINNTSKIGHINLIREEDGIARKVNPFVSYKGDYYPHLALKVGLDYLNRTENIDTKNFVIDKNSNLVIGKRLIPLDMQGSIILNWYGKSGQWNEKSFTYIPLWKLEKLAYGEKLADEESLNAEYFKDKIVYIGVSATSMYDIKSTPVDKNMPGVELHTTFINNLIDNNFIKRVPIGADIAITILVSLIIGFVVLRFESVVVASMTSVVISAIYLFLTILAMQYFNLWISVTLPIAFALFTFIGVYLVKYFRKSRDFEHTYKLATTDGLTDLYNHRYFQEQMLQNIETAKRYGTEFSLILIDIDFFKKFNDKFGHQSGDAVLKQVAQTLKKNVRTTDIVCRYGGEEMSVILTNTKKEVGIQIAQKLCEAVSERIFDLANNQKEHVTISLGVAAYPQDGETAQDIIECSDKGLYKAKENGRNQVGII